MKRLAIIVPCFNEQENVFYSCEKLTVLLESMIEQKLIRDNSYLLFVNDGSYDDTWKNIRIMADKYPGKVKGLSLASNSGHQAALASGLFNSEFDISVTVDSDLQDDITKIPEMVRLNLRGYDIVLGIKMNNYDNSSLMRFLYNIFAFTASIFNPRLVKDHADFRLCSYKAVKWLEKNIDTSNLFLRGDIVRAPFSISYVRYNITGRKYGMSKYNILKSMILAKSGIMKYGKYFLYISVLIIQSFRMLFGKKRDSFLAVTDFFILALIFLWGFELTGKDKYYMSRNITERI